MRKLATGAVSFSAAIFAANYILASDDLLLLAGALGLVGLVLALLRRKWLKRITIILFSVALGFACFAVHSKNTLGKI